MQTEFIQSNSTPSAAIVGGYDPAWFEVLAEVEDEHFWFQVRNQIISTAARKLVDELPVAPRFLEVGCGNGNVLQALKKIWPHGTAVGLDLFEDGLQRARKRCNCEVVLADIHNANLPQASFDLIGIFDVLEHLPDDENVLNILHSLLAPGGALLLTVPAFPSLWSYFDEVAGHCRRYKARSLNAKLRQAGFEIDYTSYFMATIFPLVLAKRRGPRQKSASKDSATRAIEEMKVSPILNQSLRGILQWERWWIARGWRLPVGTSLLAVARKSTEHRR